MNIEIQYIISPIVKVCVSFIVHVFVCRCVTIQNLIYRVSKLVGGGWLQGGAHLQRPKRTQIGRFGSVVTIKQENIWTGRTLDAGRNIKIIKNRWWSE